MQAARQGSAQDERSRSAGWAVATAIALLACAAWLGVARVQYLALAAVATAASLLPLPWVYGSRRRWGMLCAALLGLTIALMAGAQIELHDVSVSWPRYRQAKVSDALQTMSRELARTARELAASARDALDVSGGAGNGFAQMERLARGADERGVVLYDGGRAIAWGGQLRVSPDSVRDSVGVIASPFYLTLYARADRGSRHAVATALVEAIPPADGLAHSMAERLTERTGLSGFVFSAPSDTSNDVEVLRFAFAGSRIFDVRPQPLLQGEVLVRLEEHARIRVAVLLAIAVACFITGAWRSTRRLRWRLGALGAALACTAVVPFNEFSNYTRLFNPSLFYTPLGGSLTANAGALAITSALALLGVLAILRRHGRRRARWPAALFVVLVAGLGPFLLRDLARGVRMPAYGVSASLWLMWEVPLFLAAVTVLLAGAGAGSWLLGRSRGLPAWVAPALATGAAVMAPIVWQAPGQWPWWYTFLWIGAIAALALSRQTRYVVATAATVAALGATALVWGRTARARVDLAEGDVRGLREPDVNALSLLDRFGADLSTDAAPRTRQALLQRFVTSDLASADYPTALFAWPTDSAPSDSLRMGDFAIPLDGMRRAVVEARATGRPALRTLPGTPASEFALAVPGMSGGVTAVVVAPRTRLIGMDPFDRLLGLESEPETEAPYGVQLLEPAAEPGVDERVNWRREENELHGTLTVRTGSGAARAHVEVELRPLDALVQRGTLIVLLDLAIVGLLWLVSVVADGGVGRWLVARRRTLGRSYRTRLTIGLFAFFVIPAVVFAIWSYQQLASDARQSRDLLVQETLHAVAPDDSGTAWVADEGDRLDAPLLLYRRGELDAASDPLLQSLAPLGWFLAPSVDESIVLREEVTASRAVDIGGVQTLVGYRAVNHRRLGRVVLAATARADEMTLGRRRRDLGVLVLFATAIGALAALWLSGIAARQLARPIETLRQAALAIASGNREAPLGNVDEPTAEFRPVFAAFRRMAADLHASHTALEEAQRRTAAVLRNVASGVIALDDAGRVMLANPRADALLDVALPPRTVLADVVPRELAARVLAFLRATDDDEAFELEVDGKQFRGRLTRLARGGAVLTIDDVTAIAHAQRVLAWGEMARQIAHEIKNPLTPIRLGVQHLKRARADRRVDFDAVLDQNVGRILTEIDRLDEIARAFSRYGSAPEERAPAVPTDVAAVVRDVVALETMGAEDGDGRSADHVEWRLEGADAPQFGMARKEELREVLLNVFENARHASARHVAVEVEREDHGGVPRVTIVVRDDGAGIPEDVLPRIFEPHFSTRTSGSGLGLAISRRLIDGWGGEVVVNSTAGEGTAVAIRLKAAIPSYPPD